MNSWEYKIFYFEQTKAEEKERPEEALEKKLNEIGKDGWEVYHNENSWPRHLFVICWAKRRVEGGPYR